MNCRRVERKTREEGVTDLLLQGHRLGCCSTTLAEFYSGMREHEAPLTDQFLSSLVWYDISPGIARRAGRLRFEWAGKGTTLSLPDVLIAATALEHGLTLISDNRKHFPMPDLQLYLLPEI